MKVRSIYLLVIWGIILFSGCAKETDLNDSVFIPDYNDYSLPAYTEFGYNTFGIYFDRERFVSNDDLIPLKVIVAGDSTTFLLSGQQGRYSSSANTMRMRITLRGYLPRSTQDLLKLNDTLISLSDTTVRVEIQTEGQYKYAEILNGDFKIIRAQQLFVDDKPEEVIISGIFDFQAIIQNEPRSFTEGRFDFGLGEGNFYQY